MTIGIYSAEQTKFWNQSDDFVKAYLKKKLNALYHSQGVLGVSIKPMSADNVAMHQQVEDVMSRDTGPKKINDELSLQISVKSLDDVKQADVVKQEIERIFGDAASYSWTPATKSPKDGFESELIVHGSAAELKYAILDKDKAFASKSRITGIIKR